MQGARTSQRRPKAGGGNLMHLLLTRLQTQICDPGNRHHVTLLRHLAQIQCPTHQQEAKFTAGGRSTAKWLPSFSQLARCRPAWYFRRFQSHQTKIDTATDSSTPPPSLLQKRTSCTKALGQCFQLQVAAAASKPCLCRAVSAIAQLSTSHKIDTARQLIKRQEPQHVL